MPTELIAENSVSFNVSIRLIVKANDTGLEHTTISLEKLVDMSDGLTLTTMQEAIASKEATIRQVGISIIGVTLFLLLFSIITFASTIITNIATKKREYAMFQSIGMTRKQTETMAKSSFIFRFLQQNESHLMGDVCIGDRELDTYSDIGNYFRADIDKRLDKCRDFLFVIYISINIVYCILHCGSSDYFDDYYFRFLQFTKNSVG